tara:strand:+ start:441 stop:638 length:198 start_codon:yes stop_codon:yes gene_type:complete
MGTIIDFMLNAELSIYAFFILYVLGLSQVEVEEGSKKDTLFTVLFAVLFTFSVVTVLINGIFKGF